MHHSAIERIDLAQIRDFPNVYDHKYVRAGEKCPGDYQWAVELSGSFFFLVIHMRETHSVSTVARRESPRSGQK